MLIIKKDYGDLEESYFGIPTEEIMKDDFDWSRLSLSEISQLPDTIRVRPRRVYE